MYPLYYKQNYTLASDEKLGTTSYEALTTPHHELFCFSKPKFGASHCPIYWSKQKLYQSQYSSLDSCWSIPQYHNFKNCSILHFNHIRPYTTCIGQSCKTCKAISNSSLQRWQCGELTVFMAFFLLLWVAFHVEESTESGSPVLEL